MDPDFLNHETGGNSKSAEWQFSDTGLLNHETGENLIPQHPEMQTMFVALPCCVRDAYSVMSCRLC